MKVQYSTNLIQHLIYKNHHQGFTLIELIFVIIVIGILGVISLPSFLSCANRSKTSEGRTYVGSMNRGQEVYSISSEGGKFSNSFEELGIGIPKETKRYSYYTKAVPNAAFNYGIAKREFEDQDSLFNKKPLKSFVGGVFAIPDANKENVVVSVLCTNDKPGKIIPPQPILKNGVPSCALGTTEISR